MQEGDFDRCFADDKVNILLESFTAQWIKFNKLFHGVIIAQKNRPSYRFHHGILKDFDESINPSTNTWVLVGSQLKDRFTQVLQPLGGWWSFKIHAEIYATVEAIGGLRGQAQYIRTLFDYFFIHTYNYFD